MWSAVRKTHRPFGKIEFLFSRTGDGLPRPPRCAIALAVGLQQNQSRRRTRDMAITDIKSEWMYAWAIDGCGGEQGLLIMNLDTSRRMSLPRLPSPPTTPTTAAPTARATCRAISPMAITWMRPREARTLCPWSVCRRRDQRMVHRQRPAGRRRSRGQHLHFRLREGHVSAAHETTSRTFLSYDPETGRIAHTVREVTHGKGRASSEAELREIAERRIACRGLTHRRCRRYSSAAATEARVGKSGRRDQDAGGGRVPRRAVKEGKPRPRS